MATGPGGLLHHHLHPRRPFLHLAESHYLPCSRSSLNRPPKRFSTILSKRGLLQPSIQCVKQVEQAGSDGEAVEWVNKAAHDPMVELDPVTVFRRIVSERRGSASASASSAIDRAKEEEANLTLQTTSPPSFILGCKWPGKSTIAVIAALVLLAVGAALYFLRSRKDRDDGVEFTSAGATDTLESSVNGRRKLVKDTIKAPESVLTAMALGAASVSRPKVHTGSTHDTLHASNDNVVESQRPEVAADFHPIVNTVAVEDMESDLHGKPMFGKMPYSSSIVEDFTPLKVKNVGVDVTEGPWFGQGVNDSEMLAPTVVDSEMSLLAESQELESEKPEELEAEDGLIKSQTLPHSNETIALPSTEQSASEISVGEVGFEASVLTDMVDGQFHGKVVAVSAQPNHSNVQVLEFKFGESLFDGVLAESSMTAGKPEQIIEEDLITPLEGNGVADDTVCPEQNTVIGSSALDLSNGQFGETDSESNDDDDDNTKRHGVEQSFNLNQDDDSKNDFEGVQVAEGYLLSLNSDFVNTEEQENITNLLSGVDQTLEGIETELDDVLDGVSSSANTFQMGQVEEDEGFVCDPRNEPLAENSAAVRASEEDSRQDSKKALEAAVPAIAIGVGTVGALFGVAGGLQVVGFAALARFLSHDFLWAQSRESLWQELNGITDRQKLLDFLAKRKIMRAEEEKSSL